MSVELIYKTSSSRAIRWWKDLQEETAHVQQRRREYEDRLLEEFGPMGSRYSYSRPHSEEEQRRPLIVSRYLAVGVGCRIDEQPPEDSGWRLDSKDKWWYPKLAKSAGKVRRTELSLLALPNIEREGLKAFGILDFFSAGNYLYRPGYVFREDTQELYVVWSAFVCRKAMVRVPNDDVTWKTVSREDWYTWREAIDSDKS